MANTEQNRAIDQDLAQIKNAIYGEEVRDAIIDGIEQCYSDANDVVKVSETQPTEENVKLWVKPESQELVIPTYEDLQTFEAGVTEDIQAFKEDAKTKIIKLVSVNCCAFNYPPGSNVDESYLIKWHEMLNHADFDGAIFVDAPLEDSEAQSYPVYKKTSLFDDTVISVSNAMRNTSGVHMDQYFATRFPVKSVSRLDVTKSVVVDGTTYSNDYRWKFTKILFEFGGKNVALYMIHAAPGEGLEPLRKAQFSDLINDAKTNDYAIMVGDFNAQSDNEYKAFTDECFKLANCGYIGRINTLRGNIPADNIIVSDNILIRHFAVLEDFGLNTDHYPVSAVLQLT